MLASILASLYLWSNRLARGILGGSQAVFEGFWMGILPASAYDIISEKSYGDGSGYSNTRHLDRGFHFWEDLVVEKYFRPGSHVLVPAAGGGRELIALEKAGFQATGFDCSRGMVESGQVEIRQRGLQATLTWAPPSVAPKMPGSPFDALIVGWNGYGYISPRARRIQFLKDLRAQLKPGAPALVSTAIRPAAGRVMKWTVRIANAIRICTFRRPVFEVGDTFAGRPKMHFSRRQLEQELREGGFLPVDFLVWGGYGAIVAKAIEPM